MSTILSLPTTIIKTRGVTHYSPVSNDASSLHHIEIESSNGDDTEININLDGISYEDVAFKDGDTLGAFTLDWVTDLAKAKLTYVHDRFLNIDSEITATYMSAIQKLVSVGYNVRDVVVPVPSQIEHIIIEGPSSISEMGLYDIYIYGISQQAPQDIVASVQYGPEESGVTISRVEGNHYRLTVSNYVTGYFRVVAYDNISGVSNSLDIASAMTKPKAQSLSISMVDNITSSGDYYIEIGATPYGAGLSTSISASPSQSGITFTKESESRYKMHVDDNVNVDDLLILVNDANSGLYATEHVSVHTASRITSIEIVSYPESIEDTDPHDIYVSVGPEGASYNLACAIYGPTGLHISQDEDDPLHFIVTADENIDYMTYTVRIYDRYTGLGTSFNIEANTPTKIHITALNIATAPSSIDKYGTYELTAEVDGPEGYEYDLVWSLTENFKYPHLMSLTKTGPLTAELTFPMDYFVYFDFSTAIKVIDRYAEIGFQQDLNVAIHPYLTIEGPSLITEVGRTSYTCYINAEHNVDGVIKRNALGKAQPSLVGAPDNIVAKYTAHNGLYIDVDDDVTGPYTFTLNEEWFILSDKTTAPTPASMSVTANIAKWKGLMFTALEDSTIAAEPSYNFEYSTDEGEQWYSLNATPVSLSTGTSMWVRGNGFDNLNSSVTALHKGFTISGSVQPSGSIMSLLDRLGESTTITKEYQFAYMFYDCLSFSENAITTSIELPATTLTNGCYAFLFAGCSNMTTSPILPADELKPYCYAGMFVACSSLTSAPDLPAYTLATGCYSNMFKGCTSITRGPSLPAYELQPSCYSGMFGGCTSLSTAPSLLADTLQPYCYYEMFSGCTNLIIAPPLPATVMVQNCYYRMFRGCSKLKYVFTYALSWNSSYAYQWLDGVATYGTFTKKSGVSIVSGVSGIPTTGWTVNEV